jgi:NADPH:quinone reductase-like Zn-dependent oxidoreductase
MTGLVEGENGYWRVVFGAGKHVVVTGGTSGIGLMIARACLWRTALRG